MEYQVILDDFQYITDTFLLDIGERSKMKGLKQLTQVSEMPDDERMIAFIRSAAGSN